MGPEAAFDKSIQRADALGDRLRAAGQLRIRKTRLSAIFH
jgi:hypothetical protein